MVFRCHRLLLSLASNGYTADAAQADDGAPTPTITDWGARCQEIGVAYVKGGINGPQHNHFMFVETDDMDKLRTLMQPVMGYWDILITPVVDLK